MKTLQYIITNTGTLVYPSVLPSSEKDRQSNNPNFNQITCIYYTGITTATNGLVTGTGAVTSGLAGTITLQSRLNADCPWSPISGGTLTLSNSPPDNMAFPAGVIGQVNAIPSGVTGCNYILVRLDRGQ